MDQKVTHTELDSLKGGFKEMTISHNNLSTAITSMALASARFEERQLAGAADIVMYVKRIDNLENSLITMRGKYHAMSGFLSGMHPEWAKYRQDITNSGGEI